MAHLIRTMLIDLDGVLVPHTLTRSVPNKIAQYAVKHLGYDVATARHRCRQAYARHGTNLDAFVSDGHIIDADHFHAYIHGTLPYTEYLQEDTRMRTILNAIPSDKFVFTNADAKHAETCIHALGLGDCFQGMVSYENMQNNAVYGGVVCKPQDAAMCTALEITGADPLETLFFDDAPRNIHMAMDCGVRGVLIGRRNIHTCEYFHQLDSLHQLPTLFPSYFTDSF